MFSHVQTLDAYIKSHLSFFQYSEKVLEYELYFARQIDEHSNKQREMEANRCSGEGSDVMEINSPLVWTALPCFHSGTLVYFLRVTFHYSCIFPLPLFWCHSGIVTISITYERLLCFAAVLSSAIAFNQLLALSYYFLLFLEFLNFTKLSIYFQFLYPSYSLGTLTNIVRE